MINGNRTLKKLLTSSDDQEILDNGFPLSAMIVIGWIALASISMVMSQANENTKLLLVQMLFRHGARAPEIPYPTDPNPPESWPEGFGSLTQLGKRQHYVLGKFLRAFYSGFVTSDPNEIVVNSTDYDRCLKSALSNLASFYAPTHEWQISSDLNWQPIPVRYIASAKDRYLSMASECPLFFEEQDQRYNSSTFLNAIAKHSDMIEAVKLHSGVPDWQWVLLLQDTVICEKAHGLIVPSWLDPYWDELTELGEFAFRFLYMGKTQNRLRAGPFLQKAIENMDKKIAGINPHLKVHMFSAHDNNIIALLEALNLYSRRPPFCATLLIELHELLDGEKAVRLLYLNSTTPEDISTHDPHLLQLEGYSEFCPLKDFKLIAEQFIPEDWDKECQTTNVDCQAELESIGRLLGIHDVTHLPDPPTGTTCGPSTGSNEVSDC